MPLYVYKREDGTRFELRQSIKEDALQKCPETGQPVERIITTTATPVFNGNGFYSTDYKK